MPAPTFVLPTTGTDPKNATLEDLADGINAPLESLYDDIVDVDGRVSAVEGAAISGVTRKEAVACATTANITLSGEQTIDGVTTSTSRVLVKNQSTAAQNGIYVSASGAWSRASDMDAAGEVQGAAVFVNGGTVGAGMTFYTGSEVTALGTDAIAWVVSEDQGALSDEVSALKDKVGEASENEVAHGLVDADGRIVAFTNADGEFDFHPTEEARDRVNRVGVVQDDELLFAILDAEGKIVFSVGVDEAKDESGGSVSADSSGILIPQIPVTNPSKSVGIKTLELIQASIPVSTTAKGRTGSPDIAVNGDGLAHPKVVYIPGGWNGYEYWMALTPYFGVVGSQLEYENPHVFASNDLLSWVEPAGAPIDLPEDGNTSYWSDTHLAIGDDGYLHLWYRGNAFSFGSRCYAHRKSRDGVNWSDRAILAVPGTGEFANIESANLMLSPAFIKEGARWSCLDLLRTSSGFPIPASGSSDQTHVFRRSDISPDGTFGAYDLGQVVNYAPRAWGAGNDPWHLDAIKVGNLHLHLINTGAAGTSGANSLYLAWSVDGWNFNVLPKLVVGSNLYRSSLHLERAVGSELELRLMAGRTTGEMDLYKITLELI